MHKIYFDGACNPNPGPTGCDAVIINEKSNVVAEVSIFNGHGTNNQAEYNALIYALEKAIELGITKAKIYGDSKLVINQLNGVWNCNDSALRALHKQAMKLCYELEFVDLNWIKRADNSFADKLSQQALESNVLNNTNTSRLETSSISTNKPTSQVTIAQEPSIKIDSVQYYKGIGFAVVQNKKLYAINLSPLSCSCGNSNCEHIIAAIDYSKYKTLIKKL